MYRFRQRPKHMVVRGHSWVVVRGCAPSRPTRRGQGCHCTELTITWQQCCNEACSSLSGDFDPQLAF